MISEQMQQCFRPDLTLTQTKTKILSNVDELKRAYNGKKS